jgi:membrane fusion protein (multidrug efflux system)
VIRSVLNFCNQCSRAWKTTFIIIFFICLSVLFYKFIWRSSSKALENPNKVVEVEVVKQQAIQQRVRLLGIIHPKHTTTLIAKGSGTLDAFIATGQSVSKGTLIATIDNVDVEKNVQLSKSAEQLAKEQYERFAPLTKKGFVSPKEIEEKNQAWISTQKEFSKAKIELDNLRFYAPFDGIVGAYKKREGAQVSQGESVVSVYDPTSLVVDFDIPCSNLTVINEGQKVYVLGKSYSLTHMQKMLDEETHMCPADVDIKCSNCLIGDTVRVDLVVSEKENVIVVPFQALFLRDSHPAVFVVNKGKVQLIPVKTGVKQEDQIEIVEGLKAGQQLIIKGQDRLYPDMSVDIFSPPEKTSSL